METKTNLTMVESLRNRLGEPIAILCMRYWYRGFLTSVSESLVVLSDAYAVEQTGPASATAPQREDAIPCDVHINPNVIEIHIQPAWAPSGYTSKKIEEMKKKFAQ